MSQSITECYRVLQSVRECYRLLQSITEYCRVLQSITEYYRLLQSITECYRVLESVTECYRVLKSISHKSCVSINHTHHSGELPRAKRPTKPSTRSRVVLKCVTNFFTPLLCVRLRSPCRRRSLKLSLKM